MLGTTPSTGAASWTAEKQKHRFARSGMMTQMQGLVRSSASLWRLHSVDQPSIGAHVASGHVLEIETRCEIKDTIDA